MFKQKTWTNKAFEGDWRIPKSLFLYVFVSVLRISSGRVLDSISEVTFRHRLVCHWDIFHLVDDCLACFGTLVPLVFTQHEMACCGVFILHSKGFQGHIDHSHLGIPIAIVWCLAVSSGRNLVEYFGVILQWLDCWDWPWRHYGTFYPAESIHLCAGLICPVLYILFVHITSYYPLVISPSIIVAFPWLCWITRSYIHI